MAVTLVQSCTTSVMSGTPAASIQATFAGALTPGTFLVALWTSVTEQILDNTTTVTDGTNTWAVVVLYSPAKTAAIYSTRNSASSAATVTLTFKVAGNAADREGVLWVGEFAGVAETSPLDDTETQTAVGATASDSVTTTEDNELVVSVVANN